MENVDWTPVINVAVPGIATVLSILLTWLSWKLSDLLGVKRDAVLQQNLTTALASYTAAAIAKGAKEPAAEAAAAVAANLPDTVRKLKASPEQIERKASALIDQWTQHPGSAA